MKGKVNDLNSPKALPFGEIIENRRFRVPMYQRNYKWGAKTAGKLAQDLLENYQAGNNGNGAITKSLGLLTMYQDKDSEFLDIIDGQQRFITLSIIFSLLGDGEIPIELSFERDGEERERINAIYKEYDEKWRGKSSDVDRITRNKGQIKECIKEIIKNKNDREKFKEYILKNCVMLCSVVEEYPVKEFMNLNAYKTKFSVCDYVRSNLISLNSFYKKELNEKNSIIASCLEKHSYKTAIACLYDELLDIFYAEEIAAGTYKDVYSLVKGGYSDPDQTMESRINILFSKERLTAEKGYFSDEINKNVEEWIQMLLKVACVKKLMAQLEHEMKETNFSSAKEIDDYQKLKKKNFLDLIMNLDMTEERIDAITLAKILKKNSNVGYVLMKELEKTDLKLANRYFESFVYSSVNKATVTSAEAENDFMELPKMTDEEIISCIQGAGQYVIDRFLHEQQQEMDRSIVIAPVLDLEDRENLDFGEADIFKKNILKEGDTIAVKELYEHKFKIPVIQRDYCMGARIEEKEETEDFLGYLIRNFQDKKEVIASTILISVEKGTNDIYVFDGQQRVYTIYQLLKCCEEQYDEADSQFTFVGRKNGASKYSRRAVKNLRKVFNSRKKDINIREFKEFLHNKVKFKLKVTETVSDAEQFFLDINGGVSLKNYEIFKSCLCERLVYLKQTDFIKEMENTWLVWFYQFRDIKKEDETDIEELMEMRFIEFLCRFLITEDLKQMQEDNSGNNERLPAFDCMDSKSELVGKLDYLKYLSAVDVSQIRAVMNYLVSNRDEIRQPPRQLNTEFSGEENIDLGRTVNSQSIGSYLLKKEETQKEEFIDKHKEYILQRFIDSLADERRERLKRFYSWKDIGDLIEIYDTDLLIRDCIRRILGRKIEEGKCPYAEDKGISMFMVGGYHVRKKEIKGIPEEEIPAYYIADMQSVRYNYIRAKHIYDWAINANPISKSQRELYFIWTKKGKKSVRKDDGEETYIVFSNRLEYCSLCEFNNTLFNEYTYTIMIQNKCRQIWLKNRTDAYFLNSEVVRDLINNNER